MPNKLPLVFKNRVLEMPEYRQGVNKIKVRLQSGIEYSSVFVAWGSEIVKVGASTEIPFEVNDIVYVENDL